MESVQTFLHLFSDATFTIPVGQVALFVIIVSICMLLGRHRIGLLVTLGFVFFWSFVLNFRYFVEMLESMTWGLQLYALAGLLLFAVIILGLFMERRS